jgi:hypothetical protein
MKSIAAQISILDEVLGPLFALQQPYSPHNPLIKLLTSKILANLWEFQKQFIPMGRQRRPGQPHPT